jgi:tetratricopeptide (TPR) repeat protein
VAKRSSRRPANPNTLSIGRSKSGNGWVLIPPRSVRDCGEDLEEVQAMIEAGEYDVAIDELHWLLGNEHELIEAHFLLGKLAVEVKNDIPLGRGHFGLGYQLGMKALRKAKFPKPVPALHPANRLFYDAGRGLVWCLHSLGKPEMAIEVAEQLLKFDPDDPLGLASWLDEIRTDGKQMVDIGSLLG